MCAGPEGAAADAGGEGQLHEGHRVFHGARPDRRPRGEQMELGGRPGEGSSKWQETKNNMKFWWTFDNQVQALFLNFHLKILNFLCKVLK